MFLYHEVAALLRLRPTLRTQLTLLYAGPFFVSAVLLLSVPLLQTRESVPAGTQRGPGPVVQPGTDMSRILTLSAVALAAMIMVSIVLGWLVAGRAAPGTEPEGVRGPGVPARLGRPRGVRRGAPGTGVGRGRRPVHDRGEDDDPPPAGQARRSAGDPHGT